MKVLKLKYYIVTVLVCCCLGKAFGQDKGYKVNMEMTVDEKGDAAIDISTKYNAQLWDVIKQNHNADASVLKNNWKRQFPKYQLTEFDIKTNEMENTVISKFKILGMIKLDESGKWVANLDQKDPNITKINDVQFLLVDEATALTLKINLPKSASGAKIEKDAFGKSILTYSAPISGGGLGNIIKYLGFLVAAGGIFLFFKGGGLKTIVVNDGKNKKIEYHQAKKIDDAVVINTPAKDPVRSNNDIGNSHE